MSRRPRANGKTPRLRCPISRTSPRRRRPKTKLSRICRRSRDLTSNPISRCSCARTCRKRSGARRCASCGAAIPCSPISTASTTIARISTSIDTPITLAQTSYRVGKGYFDEAEEKLSELGDARTAQADKSSNARRGESSKRSAESPVAADSDDAPDKRRAKMSRLWKKNLPQRGRWPPPVPRVGRRSRTKTSPTEFPAQLIAAQQSLYRVGPINIW